MPTQSAAESRLVDHNLVLTVPESTRLIIGQANLKTFVSGLGGMQDQGRALPQSLGSRAPTVPGHTGAGLSWFVHSRPWLAGPKSLL